jgi:hypothetical protein
MKKSNETLSATDIEQVRCTVEEALLTLIANHPEELPAGGPWWLEPDSTEAEVLRYSAIFGQDHLAELATGILHDLNREQYWSSDWLIDFNGAAGLNGAMLALLGLGSRVLVVDHCPAAGEVAVKLGALLGVECEYRNVTCFQTDAIIDPAAKSVFLLASHAQNVLYFDEERDGALEIQNQILLQTLAANFPNVEALSAISLEPSRGRRGLQDLLYPWHENFQVENYSQVPVAKFGRGLRVGHKKFESAILAKATVNS